MTFMLANKCTFEDQFILCFAFSFLEYALLGLMETIWQGKGGIVKKMPSSILHAPIAELLGIPFLVKC